MLSFKISPYRDCRHDPQTFTGALVRLFEDERFAPVDDSFQDLHLPGSCYLLHGTCFCPFHHTRTVVANDDVTFAGQFPDLEIQEPSGHGPGVIESLDEVEVPTGTSEGRGSGNCNLTTGAAETVDREGSSDTPVPLNGAPVASTELGGNASDVEQNPADREAQLAPELPEALVAPKSVSCNPSFKLLRKQGCSGR